MYTVIDGETELVYGPFDTFTKAHQYAWEHLNIWEILNEHDAIVHWHNGYKDDKSTNIMGAG